MNLPGSWLHELQRFCLVVMLAGLLGWLLGYPFIAMAIASLGLNLMWLGQLLRIRLWLDKPEQAPPESRGIWGIVFDRIYHLQRQNRESQARLQSTVDYLQDSFVSMRDGAVMVDENGVIDWSNAAAQRLLGLRYPQDRGQPLLNLVRLPEFHRYFLSRDYQEPLQLRSGNDSNLMLQFEITPFGAGDRLVFIRDVTKLAKLEQMRRDFVGNVSHELRTPLTVIKGYIETILGNSAALDPRYVKPLQQMEQQAQRMENLLRDLLWLSRIESDHARGNNTDVDIAGLVEELEGELQSSHPHRRLELDLQSRHKVRGDYRELHSAVSNLVLNALKYSGDDSPVRVSWQQVGDEFLLSVHDSGIGIDAVHLPRLTERFYRVDDSRSSRTGGTGLGLAIVKHAAAAHKAKLRIASRPGEGSTFTLAFPSA